MAMSEFALMLFILVDVLGAVGAILVIIPISRDLSIRSAFQTISTLPSLFGPRTDEDASKAIESELQRFKREDLSYIYCGIVMISVSYFLHIVAELVEHRIIKI